MPRMRAWPAALTSFYRLSIHGSRSLNRSEGAQQRSEFLTHGRSWSARRDRQAADACLSLAAACEVRVCVVEWNVEGRIVSRLELINRIGDQFVCVQSAGQLNL